MKINSIWTLLIVIFLTHSLNANQVSNLEGSLAVNQGTLNYSIPLNLPPGVAGVQPKLSLNYNSNSSNDYLGSGWGLSGLSVITRCGSEIIENGFKRGVRYDEKDNICLNGSKLTLVSGNKWDIGSEYKTKIDIHSKIVYKGNSFEEWTKTGDLKEYTLINRNWFLTKVSDRFGNSIDYNYFSTSSEVYLNNITYADNKISFVYENKPDYFHGYSDTYNVRVTKRVQSIKVEVANTVLRTYSLGYKAQASVMDKSLLTTLTECVDNECLQPIEFTYKDTTLSFLDTIQLDFLTSPKNQITYSDFNADGLMDIYEDKGYTNIIWFNNGDNTFTKTSHSLGSSNRGEIRFNDFNSDGLLDIYEFEETGTYDHIWLNQNNGVFLQVENGNAAIDGVATQVIFQDFNSDGLVDIYDENGYIKLNKGNFNGEFVFERVMNDLFEYPGSGVQYTIFQDFNGDFLIDAYDTNSKKFFFNEGYESVTDSIHFSFTAYPFNKVSFADFNGDGYVDVYNINDTVNEIWLNQGNGIFIQVTDDLPFNMSTEVLFSDINNDGMTDIYDRTNNTIYFSKGEYYDDGDKVVGFINETQYTPAVDGTNIEFIDFNGDGFPDIYEVDTQTVYINSLKKNQLISIADSFKNQTSIEYKNLTDSSVYTKYQDAHYPEMDIQPCLEVVSSISSMGPNKEILTNTYQYEGLRVNLLGLGSLGFAKIITNSNSNMLKTIEVFNQEYPYVGLPQSTETYLEGELTSTTSNQYDNLNVDDIYKVYKKTQNSQFYENGLLLKSVSISYNSYDEFGNIGTVTTNTVDETRGEVFTNIVNNTYTNNPDQWILSRLTQSIVTNEAYGDIKVKKSIFTYDNVTGILTSETIEPNTTKWLKKSYQYDNHGNLIKETVSGADILQRTTTTNYDALGKYPIQKSNALGHSEYREYNLNGQLIKVTDANGLFATYSYDNFGKKLAEVDTSGVSTSYTYEFDESLPLSLYSVTITTAGTAPIKTYFNSLGQELRSEKLGFHGKKIFEDTFYDKFGNVIKKSSPYFNDEAPVYSYFTLDKYQRLVKVDVPGPNNQRVININSYSGYQLIHTDAKGHQKTTTKNVLGKVIKIEEENTYQLYNYDALGNLISTIDPYGNSINIQYDIFGNKIYQNDPDMGAWSYGYNALGELISQTDAKGQTTLIEYDLLGRKVSENLNGVISTWEYDLPLKGKLFKESKPNFTRVYDYDTKGRVRSVSTTMDSKTFLESFTYDTFSRLETKTLPNNFQIKNVYNQYGYLESIKSPKQQIADFDATHFVSLIEQTLGTALEYYQLSLELQAKADNLRLQIVEYEELANYYESEKDYLLTQIFILQNNIEEYEYEARKYARLAEETKAIADDYLNQANSEHNEKIADRYYDLARLYQGYHAMYLVETQNALTAIENSQQLVTSYEATVSEYQALIDNYTLLVNNAIAELTTTLQTIEQLKEHYTDEMATLASAYQSILDDTEYKYFYKVLESDSYNRVTQYISGNGLITTKSYDVSGLLNNITTGYNFTDGIRNLTFEYDLLANVTQREDKKLGVLQTYQYDNINRLIYATENANNNFSEVNYEYDLIGNIKNKSDVGAYNYSSVAPHQVLSAGSKTFSYDSNGNMINNNGALLEYTAFNKVSKITTDQNVIEFAYDTNHNRYKKSTDNYTTYYLGQMYEQKISNSVTEDKYFIYVGSKLISIYTNAGANSSTKYLHYDSLRSVDTVTNNLGVVEERMAYKPFGEKLNLDENGDTLTSSSSTNRGYTGHEHIEETNFINMNARLYDPTIGRFLSADSMIPGIYDTQSFNRYAYVKNNPLKYIDPSGHWGLSDIGSAISGAWKSVGSAISGAWKSVGNAIYKNRLMIATVIITVVVSTVTFGAGMALVGALGVTNATLGTAIVASTMGAAGGFAGAFSGTLMGGGNLGEAVNNGLTGALVGGVSAGVAFGIAEGTAALFNMGSSGAGHATSFFNPQGGYTAATFKALAHGTSRAAIAQAQGQNAASGFWSGFTASGFSVGSSGFGKGMTGVMTRTAIMAGVAGTVSEMTGGKFANGAMTGAFIHLFNAEGTRLVANPKGSFIELTKENYFFKSKSDEYLKAFYSIDYHGRNQLRTELYTATKYTLKGVAIFSPEPYTKNAARVGYTLMRVNESEWNY
jgi:RHS repeat-associated protein